MASYSKAQSVTTKSFTFFMLQQCRSSCVAAIRRPPPLMAICLPCARLPCRLPFAAVHAFACCLYRQRTDTKTMLYYFIFVRRHTAHWQYSNTRSAFSRHGDIASISAAIIIKEHVGTALITGRSCRCRAAYDAWMVLKCLWLRCR